MDEPRKHDAEKKNDIKTKGFTLHNPTYATSKTGQKKKQQNKHIIQQDRPEQHQEAQSR